MGRGTPVKLPVFLMPIVESVQKGVRRYLPSLQWGFPLLWKLEIAVIVVAVIVLYVIRIHPYLVLTSSDYAEQQRLSEETTVSLVKRYTEEKETLENWWESHVMDEANLSQLLQDLNPMQGSQMIGSVKVGDTVAKEGYRQVSIQTSFQGDYKALVEWTAYLEKLPYFLQIQALDLKPHPHEEINKEALPSPVLVGQVTVLAILK